MNNIPITPDGLSPDAAEQLGDTLERAAAEQGETVSAEDAGWLIGALNRMIQEGRREWYDGEDDEEECDQP